MSNALAHARATAPGEVDFAPAGESIDMRIEALQKARETADAALSGAYYELLEAREEIDLLRRQLIEVKLEYFTREQFAEKLQVSVDTVDGLVKRRKISYVRLTPRLKRFTSVHLVEVARLLEVKAAKAGSQISDSRFQRA